MPRTDPQLSFNVAPHPEVLERQARNEGTWLTAELKVPVELDVHDDLQPGDRLHVTVAGDDGTVLGSMYAEVASVAFVPIREKDLGVIGTTRVHKAKRADA